MPRSPNSPSTLITRNTATGNHYDHHWGDNLRVKRNSDFKWGGVTKMHLQISTSVVQGHHAGTARTGGCGRRVCPGCGLSWTTTQPPRGLHPHLPAVLKSTGDLQGSVTRGRWLCNWLIWQPAGASCLVLQNQKVTETKLWGRGFCGNNAQCRPLPTCHASNRWSTSGLSFLKYLY